MFNVFMILQCLIIRNNLQNSKGKTQHLLAIQLYVFPSSDTMDFYQTDPAVLSALITHMEINFHITLVLLLYYIAIWKLEPKALKDPF